MIVSEKVENLKKNELEYLKIVFESRADAQTYPNPETLN